MTQTENDSIAKVRDSVAKVKIELSKAVIGQDEIIQSILIALLAKGHALITGAPGLGKTLLVKSIAQTLSLGFNRIQFTPDLMPADIFGTEIVEEDLSSGHRQFRFVQGPVFTNILLADEINRTPPKTQAALLEAMGEGQVTAAGKTYTLDTPFFVLATENPIEMEGTYPLPEAQLDRFIFNLIMDYLPAESEAEMVAATTSPAGEPPAAILSADEIRDLQALVRRVPVSTRVIDYAVRLVRATRPESDVSGDWSRQYIRWGAGSRASQALILAGKARCLLDGRVNVSPDDVRELALPVLRHRVLPSFQAQAEGLRADDLIRRIVEETREG